MRATLVAAVGHRCVALLPTGRCRRVPAPRLGARADAHGVRQVCDVRRGGISRRGARSPPSFDAPAGSLAPLGCRCIRLWRRLAGRRPAHPKVRGCASGCPWAPSPAEAGRSPAGPGGACQAATTRRSCRLSRLQRLVPRVALRACCIPLPIMGFAQFSGPPCRLRRAGRDQPPSSTPAALRARPLRAVSPFGAFPLLADLHRRPALSRRPRCCRRTSRPGRPTPQMRRRPLGVSRPGLPSRRFSRGCVLLLHPPPLQGVGRRRLLPRAATSGRSSTSRSVAPVPRCHDSSARCSLGLVRPPAPPLAGPRCAAARRRLQLRDLDGPRRPAGPGAPRRPVSESRWPRPLQQGLRADRATAPKSRT